MKCCNCKNLGKLKDEDGVPYDWCEKVCDNPDIHLERKCKHYVVASRADKLRSMSDEELADWLVMNGNGEDYKTWLDWLRQEAQDG